MFWRYLEQALIHPQRFDLHSEPEVAAVGATSPFTFLLSIRMNQEQNMKGTEHGGPKQRKHCSSSLHHGVLAMMRWCEARQNEGLEFIMQPSVGALHILHSDTSGTLSFHFVSCGPWVRGVFGEDRFRTLPPPLSLSLYAGMCALCFA